MTTPSQHPIDYAYFFPWTRIFRSFRIATDPRKMALAAVGVVLIWCGDQLISYLPFATGRAALPPWELTQPQSLIAWSPGASTIYDDPAARTLALATRLIEIGEPFVAFAVLLFRGDSATWEQIATYWTRLLWALAVWSIFGGAIARLAAIEIARDERGSLWQSLVFAAKRFLSFFAAPLLPVAAVLLIWGLAALGGLVGRAPAAGEWIVALFWGLALCLGLLATLITVATVAGWPLMVAAIATENSDGFDGFSRSFSYLFSRPWLFVWSIVVAALFGILSIAVIDTVVLGATAGAARMVSTGMGHERILELHADSVGYFDRSETFPFHQKSANSNAAAVTKFWLGIAALAAVGFAASFFWTAATVVYFLLRRADDGTQFDEVWLNESDEEDRLLPLAGIAATDQAVTERPHQPTMDRGAKP